MADREPDSKPLITTPVAIVLASVFLSVALYFGLRSRETPATSVPAPTTPAATASEPTVQPAPPVPPTAAPTTPSAAPTSATPTGSADPKKVAALVTELLEKQRKTLNDQCVKPSLAAQPSPPTIKLTFDITFGADGKQIARGILEDRENKRAGIGTCIQEKLPSLEIGPQPTSVSLQVPWTLP